jgi:hypothetical protein
MTRLLTTILVGTILLSSPARGWEKFEHRLLADSAMTQVVRECEISVTGPNGNTFENLRFADLVVDLAEDDMNPTRFHRTGKTILEQLREVSDSNWNDLLYYHPQTDKSTYETVITGFLYWHLKALHQAAQESPGGSHEQNLVHALRYEAKAQGFLADAFTAGHLLTPVHTPFSGLQRVNIKSAHHSFNTTGLFVMNSRGDLWRTFGNGNLLWYPESYHQVYNACLSSLRELMLVHQLSTGVNEISDSLASWLAVELPGVTAKAAQKSWLAPVTIASLYEEQKLPSLMRIPMPISATWSVRVPPDSGQAFADRKHFPQMSDPGYYDSSLSRHDRRYLYSQLAFPDWLFFPKLANQEPSELIRDDPDVASVHFTQQWSLTPAYRGLLTRLGGSVIFQSEGRGSGYLMGLGYGLADDLLLVERLSIEADLQASHDEPRRTIVRTTAGFGIKRKIIFEKLPDPLEIIESFRIEFGGAFGLKQPFRKAGFTTAIGLESTSIQLPGLYIGAFLRTAYQWNFLDRTVHGLSFNLIFH